MKKTGTSVLQTQRKSITDFRKTNTRRYSQVCIAPTLHSSQSNRPNNLSKNDSNFKPLQHSNKIKNVPTNFLPANFPESLSISTRAKSALKSRPNNGQKVTTQQSIKMKRQSIPSQIRTQNKKSNPLFANSNKIRKIVWNQNQYNSIPIIISADYIINQDDFWDKPGIPISLIKSWKLIHQQYYVIIVLRNQKSFIRIRQFISTHQLPIHALYYLRYKRKYTTDYTPIIKQITKSFNCQKLQKIPIFQILKLNLKDLCEHSSFEGKIPILQPQVTKITQVYYIRVQQNCIGFENILFILKNSSKNNINKFAKLTAIKQYINQQYKNLIKQQEENQRKKFREQNKKQIQYIDQQEAQERVNDFKKEMIDGIIKHKGRSFQYQGNSLYYLVGDIIKRNYNRLIDSKLLIPKPNKQRRTQASSRNNNFTQLFSPTHTKQRIQLDIPIEYYEYYHYA